MFPASSRSDSEYQRSRTITSADHEEVEKGGLKKLAKESTKLVSNYAKPLLTQLGVVEDDEASKKRRKEQIHLANKRKEEALKKEQHRKEYEDIQKQAQKTAERKKQMKSQAQPVKVQTIKVQYSPEKEKDKELYEQVKILTKQEKQEKQ